MLLYKGNKCRKVTNIQLENNKTTTGGNNMKKIFFQNIFNRWELEKENNLYEVEVNVQKTTCWEKFEDVTKTNKLKTVNFEKFKGMQLYATLIDAHDQLFWKLYVVNGKKVDIFYVKSADLNPTKIVYKL